VHRGKVSKYQSQIAVEEPDPCPVVVRVEVVAIESSRLPVRAKWGVRVMGMMLVHGQGQGEHEVIAGDRFAAGARLASDSAWAVLEGDSI